MPKNSRQGTAYVVKMLMRTTKGDDNDYRFMKVEGFVNFHKEEDLATEMLIRQVARKVEFYEKLYNIVVTAHSFVILSKLSNIEFLPKPYFETTNERKLPKEITNKKNLPESVVDAIKKDYE